MPGDRTLMPKPSSKQGEFMRRALAGVISVGLVAILGAVSADTASASPKPKKYANCKALNKVYPHGVGRTAGARDKTSGQRVTNFKVSKAVYNLNTAKDRDKDKIACEKR
jgi:Excalibur calcium-binding domain